MSRYTASALCAEDGCNERGLFAADTRKEQTAIYVRYRKDPWKCTRHRRPNEVLSIENPVVEHVLEIYDTDFGSDPSSRFYKLHHFWTDLDRVAEKKGGNGFSHGPGFKAFAEDFPAGTRLIVTARVELPAALPSRETDAPKETHDGA